MGWGSGVLVDPGCLLADDDSFGCRWGGVGWGLGAAGHVKAYIDAPLCILHALAPSVTQAVDWDALGHRKIKTQILQKPNPETNGKKKAHTVPQSEC